MIQAPIHRLKTSLPFSAYQTPAPPLRVSNDHGKNHKTPPVGASVSLTCSGPRLLKSGQIIEYSVSFLHVITQKLTLSKYVRVRG